MDPLSFQSDSNGRGVRVGREGRLALSCQLFLSPLQTLVLKILLSDFVIIHNGGFFDSTVVPCGQEICLHPEGMVCASLTVGFSTLFH